MIKIKTNKCIEMVLRSLTKDLFFNSWQLWWREGQRSNVNKTRVFARDPVEPLCFWEVVKSFSSLILTGVHGGHPFGAYVIHPSR